MKVKAICGICQGGCHVLATIENGKLIKVERDPADPMSRLCPRGAMAPEILYSEQRIKTPMIRTGERGAGQFRSATWEEALEFAAHKIKETTPYGGRVLPAAVADAAEGSVHMPHGGGSSYMSKEWEYGAANALTPLNLCDEVSGFVLIKSVPCKIEKM